MMVLAAIWRMRKIETKRKTRSRPRIRAFENEAQPQESHPTSENDSTND